MKDLQTHTFWSLLQTYSIEIPKIQRDYAQGRNNRKTEIIRENILTAFFNVIDGKSIEKLNLDFIYGSINTQNKLTPLDGQQRLTTLFLLHWYLASISGNKADNTDTFLKFTYETRLSSRRFCDALVRNELTININEPLSAQISDTTWFYFTWKKDPTIKAMLTMLDAIHEKFNGKTDFWKHLMDSKIIEFQFLPLNKFKLSDELYVKMNARGKPLSDFENFKSWLDDKLESKTTDEFKKAWSLKLDTIWTDLFWNNDDGDYSLDEEMMTFFRGISMFNFVNKFELNDETKKDFEKSVGELNDLNLYLSNDEFDKLLFKENKNTSIEVVKYDVFEEIDSFLDRYCENEAAIINRIKKVFFWEEGLNTIFLNFIRKPTYSQRVMFYGLFKYLLRHPENFKDNENECIRFFRVLRNLVENTEITASNIKNILISINKIIDSNDILKSLTSEKLQLQGFDGSQLLEEQKKARLILENPNWETEIIQAENHLLFKGSIKFIIDFSSDEIEKFKKYFNLLELIFNKNGNKFSEKNLFQRALLTKGDYTKNGDKLLNNSREWKMYLKQSSDKLDNLKKLLDDELFDKEDVSNSFKSIIDKYLANEENIKNESYWRFNLIKHENIWNVSEYKFLRRYNDYVGIRRKERNSFNDNLPINSFREIIISKLVELNPNFKLIQPSSNNDVNFEKNRIVNCGINFYKNEWVGVCLDNSKSYFPVLYFGGTNYLEIGIRKQKFEPTLNKFILENDMKEELEYIGENNLYWEYYKQVDYSIHKFNEMYNFTNKLFDDFNKLNK